MIAWLGELMHKSGSQKEQQAARQLKEIDFDPYERTDAVDVKWR